MRTAFFFQRGPGRFNTALLFSLLAHALLLSVAFGGQTFGLPGLNFPWKERRLGADDLQIMLAPARPTAAQAADISPTEMARAVVTANDEPTVASDARPMTMPPPVVGQEATAAASIPPPAPAPSPKTAAVIASPPEPVVTAPERADVKPRSEATVPSDAAQKQIDQDARQRALEQARLEREQQSAERLRQAALMADAKREATRQEQLRQDAARAEQTVRSEAARMEAERQELARQDAARRESLQKERAGQEAARQELERAEAARAEAGRSEAARQEQARLAQIEAARQAKLDAARQNAIKQEAARQDAIKQEAAQRDAIKQETARQDAMRQESARQDAQKQEAARQDAIRQESARQDAAKQEAARQERAKQELAQKEKADQEVKREERLRAIGKQLNEEAAQRDAASNNPSRSLLPGVSTLRRGWLFGRADPNADLVLYAEAMSRKIEMNMTFDMVREAVKQPHARPIVTVAVRADGSVEKVTFVVSSGVAAIDEAIRKVVASQVPYAAFPPSVARQYDVIEIRRTWIFDTAIRLQ